MTEATQNALERVSQILHKAGWDSYVHGQSEHVAKAARTMRTFTPWFNPLSVVELNAAEKRLGVQLSVDYRSFLLNTNGLCPENYLFTVPERGDVLLGCLYGIRPKRDHGDLEYEQEGATLWDPLPPGFIAIGHDPGGSTLLLSTLGHDAGQVLFWDRVGFWIREDGRNTFSVATNFNGFLESLWEAPQD